MGCAKLLACVMLAATTIVVSANASEICNAKDSPSTCAMLDAFATTSKELFNTEGARRALVAEMDAKNAYWQKYTSGVSEVPGLLAHVVRACAWKGVQNKPTAELCSWWKGLRP
jgi:hypothetical protein